MRLIIWLAVWSTLLTPAMAQPQSKPNASAQAGPFAPILKWTTDDIDSAIKAARAAQPPDTDAVNCYQSLRSTLQLVQANGGVINWPPTLITDYELAWLIHAQITALKVNSACAVVCGRAATMLAIYGTAINNFCTTLAKLP